MTVTVIILPNGHLVISRPLNSTGTLDEGRVSEEHSDSPSEHPTTFLALSPPALQRDALAPDLSARRLCPQSELTSRGGRAGP